MFDRPGNVAGTAPAQPWVRPSAVAPMAPKGKLIRLKKRPASTVAALRPKPATSWLAATPENTVHGTLASGSGCLVASTSAAAAETSSVVPLSSTAASSTSAVPPAATYQDEANPGGVSRTVLARRQFWLNSLSSEQARKRGLDMFAALDAAAAASWARPLESEVLSPSGSECPPTEVGERRSPAPASEN